MTFAEPRYAQIELLPMATALDSVLYPDRPRPATTPPTMAEFAAALRRCVRPGADILIWAGDPVELADAGLEILPPPIAGAVLCRIPLPV
jgi:hypothetical protein